jgi:hypothetical protein
MRFISERVSQVDGASEISSHRANSRAEFSASEGLEAQGLEG